MPRSTSKRETPPQAELDPAGALPHVLREYALLADGERGILVGPRGDFAWMCFPTWDSTAVFSSLIGGSGSYSITPRGPSVWGGYYEPASLIWHSRWVTVDNAIIECREALALPTQPERAVVLRRVIARQATAQLNVTLYPRGNFGNEPLRRLARDESGHWRGQVGDIQLAWFGGENAQARTDGHGGKVLQLELTLEPGEEHDLALVFALDTHGLEPLDFSDAWRETETAWRERVPELEQTTARHDARHAYAVLTGLTCQGGGMVAAATMSLPERARQGRNYDYRYVWIRDQCYAGQAIAEAGPYPLLDDAVRFVARPPARPRRAT